MQKHLGETSEWPVQNWSALEFQVQLGSLVVWRVAGLIESRALLAAGWTPAACSGNEGHVYMSRGEGAATGKLV